ncbi:hypothetical protein AM391_RS21295 [Kluyvera ascorbata]|nr:hypothetical protein [Kluyvera ascorbata]
MQANNSRSGLVVLFYLLFATVSTVWILETYGAEIIKYQVQNSTLFSFINAMNTVSSGIPSWEILLPISTFLICLTAGLLFTCLCGLLLFITEQSFRSINAMSVFKLQKPVE